MMGTAAVVRDPRELAAELALPLLAAVPPVAAVEGPVSPRVPADPSRWAALEAVALRILAAPGPAEIIGVAGDLPAAERAEMAGALAAVLAGERSTVLIDADVRGAHLAFDSSARAQEGLVDVLRYGVRSPRVVGPTGTPGLSLLPVGSGTVDFAGTYASDATVPLFAELRRTGDLLVVNGPDARDIDAAGRFLDLVDVWVLVGSGAGADASALLSLRDRLGRSRCLGVAAVAAGSAAPVAARAAAPVEPGVPPAPPVAAVPSAAREEELVARAVAPRRSALRVWGFGLGGVAAVTLAVLLLRPSGRPERAEPSAEPRVLPRTESAFTEQRVTEPRVAEPREEASSEMPPPVPSPAPPPATASAGSIWGVHLASLRTEAGARQEAARFEAKGMATLLREVEIEGKGRWVRVYAGPFAERGEAEAAARRVRELGLQEYALVQRLAAENSRPGTGREDR
jgi:DedD protein